MRYDGQMSGVDKGNHEWDDGISAVVFGIGEDDELGGAECGLCGGERGATGAGRIGE